MKKTLEQLRKEIRELLDESKQLYAKADAEKRSLSDEEETRAEEILKGIDERKAEITKLEDEEAKKNRRARLQQLGDELTQPQPRIVPPANPDEDRSAAAATPPRLVLPASARRHRPQFIRDCPYTGMRANERAYRIGQWFLATRGVGASRRFCRDHGVELIGWNAETNQEIRLHQEDVNYQGGYLVPEELDDAMIDLKEQYGLARRLFRRSTMRSDTKSRSRRAGGLTAYFVGEGSAGTESTMSWDRVNLVAKKLMILTRITNELNEDAAVEIADILVQEAGYAFAEKEDDCAFNGDGTSTYGRIVGVRQKLKDVDSTIGNIKGLTVAAGNTFAEFTLANFNTVVGTLPMYADTPRAVWVMHKVLWAIAEKLMHAAGGNTVENYAGKPRRSFMGYPVEISQKMPKTDANSQVAALLGDFSLAADFGDRQQTSIATSESATINSESVFETDELGLRATERIDVNVHDVGNTTDAGPVVGLISAAS